MCEPSRFIGEMGLQAQPDGSLPGASGMDPDRALSSLKNLLRRP
jgi:hypothetical protein